MTDNLAWRFVSTKDIDALSNIHETDACRKFFEQLFIFPNMEASLPCHLLLDLYLFLYSYCKDNDFSSLKTSALLGIMHKVVLRDVFLQSADQGKKKPWSLSASYQHFESLLLLHSVERPPKSTGIFDVKDVSSAVDYFTHNYFRHYYLYQSLFIPQEHVSIVQGTCMDIEKPKVAPVLRNAIMIREKVEPMATTEEISNEP